MGKKINTTVMKFMEDCLPITTNVRPLADVRDLNTVLVNVVMSPAYWQAVVGRS